MEGPRPAKKEEFDELMILLDQVFKPGGERSLRDEFPHVYINQEKMLKNMIIVKENGQVVSHASIIPLKVFVSESVLEVGGIGGVATKAKYRRRGFASRILNYCISRMKEYGFDISILWGLRDCYRRLGWELGGREYIYTLTKRSIPLLDSKSAQVWKYEGDEGDLEKIIRIHGREPMHVMRSRDTYKLLLGLPPDEVWLSQIGQKDHSYAVIRGEGRRRIVAEFGGKRESFSQLLKHIIEQLQLEELLIPAPPTRSELTSLLVKVSLYWTINPLGMIRIIDLRRCLEKLRDNMNANLEKSGQRRGEVSLEVRDTGQKVTLETDREVHISEKEVRSKVRLDQREMVRLIFGLDSPSRGFQLKSELGLLLDQVFPVDLYLRRLDHI